MDYALAILVLAVVVAIVVAVPLRRGSRGDAPVDDRREALEAAKEAKYREIRDAELDYRMGKLSEEDFKRTDGELRAQAIGILKQIDEADGR